MIYKNRLVIILLLIFSICLTGCKNKKSDADPSKDLNIALGEIPSTMDPQKAADQGSIQYLVPWCATLFKVTSQNMLEPMLAESYEISEDGLKYTIHLKDGIFYSDGSEIEAEDFAFAIRRIVDPWEASSAVYLFNSISKIKNVDGVIAGELPMEKLGVSAADDKTLVIELENPCAYFLFLLTKVCTAPCKESFYKECGGNYCTSPETMLSSGAFIVDKYEVLGTETRYKKNPYYLFADKVSLPGLLIRKVSNTQQSEMLYQSGAMDFIQVSRDFLVLSLDDKNLKNIRSNASFFLVGSFKNSRAWANKNIRIAINKSIDREAICKDYFKLGADPMTRVVPEGFASEPDGSDFVKDRDKYYDICGFDKDKALDYWNKGLKELGLSKLNIELSGSGGNTDLYEILKNQLESNLPGFELDIKTCDSAEYMSKLNSGNYELMLTGWGADYPDPDSFLNYWKIGASTNTMGFDGKEFSELMTKASYEPDPEKRMDHLHKAEDKIMEDIPMVPLYVKSNSYLISDRVKNLEINEASDVIIADFAEKR
ncbi:MAG: peptide ABC transporter substrate-binding protein [Lachnospiraceae bacterium]|nr:peptide ABC transporter substrate-binding protein [Lachnospiraceae bacterium]